MPALSKNERTRVLILAQLISCPERISLRARRAPGLPLEVSRAISEAFSGGVSAEEGIERLRTHGTPATREAAGVLEWVLRAKTARRRRSVS